MVTWISLPTCSKCNETIILTDQAMKCSNPACGRVVCFMCAITSVEFCWVCSNPLTSLTSGTSTDDTQSSAEADVPAAKAKRSLDTNEILNLTVQKAEALENDLGSHSKVTSGQGGRDQPAGRPIQAFIDVPETRVWI